MQRSALCRSRRELSNAYLLAKFGFDKAENEPAKVCLIDAEHFVHFVGRQEAAGARGGGLLGGGPPRRGAAHRERFVSREPKWLRMMLQRL